MFRDPAAGLSGVAESSGNLSGILRPPSGSIGVTAPKARMTGDRTR